MKEIRKISSDKVRHLCIKDDYYTRGSNKEYTNLLCNLCDGTKKVTLSRLQKIAEDILQHSDWEEKAHSYGYDYEELLKAVMTNLINECCYSFIE